MRYLLLSLMFLLVLVASFNVKSEIITLSKSNSVLIDQAIDAQSVSKAAVDLMKKCATNSGKDLYLVLYSPGGSVSDGKNFIDFVQALPCKVHTITAFAASMAYQIVQSLGTRYIIQSGVLMSHRAAVDGLGGQFPGELNSRLQYLTDMVTELDKRTANRIGITLSAYKKEIHDELWLTHDRALEKNHADVSALVRCDKTLYGTRIVDVQTMFGTFKVEFSDCPMIFGPLDIKYPNNKVNEKADKEIREFFDPTKVKIIYGY